LHNPAFLTKVGILVPVGVIWHVVVQQKVRRLNAGTEVPKGVKIAGLVELLLWVSVATAAVLIPTFA
jgi:ligand-binding SRPBCC domain-containing protein